MLAPWAQPLIDRALEEDLALGDPTTQALIPPSMTATASVVAKSQGVLAGSEVGLAVFQRVDPSVEVELLMDDGSFLAPADVIAQMEGSAASILKAERVALNFLQRLSGIATATALLVQAVKGLPVKIVDTRKTTPGLRSLEKYAVTVGGGYNHRQALGDGILIKDNHIALLRSQGWSVQEIVRQAIERAPHTLQVEVEVETLEEALAALEGGAHILLLDNMDLETMRLVVEMAKGKALTEASGGINLETVRAVAETGVDLISVGAITHSVRALDISLDIATS